jgi:hypothetical protein
VLTVARCDCECWGSGTVITELVTEAKQGDLRLTRARTEDERLEQLLRGASEVTEIAIQNTP